MESLSKCKCETKSWCSYTIVLWLGRNSFIFRYSVCWLHLPCSLGEALCTLQSAASVLQISEPRLKMWPVDVFEMSHPLSLLLTSLPGTLFSCSLLPLLVSIRHFPNQKHYFFFKAHLKYFLLIGYVLEFSSYTEFLYSFKILFN